MFGPSFTVALLLSYCVTIANSVIVRYYNEVRHKDYDSFEEFQKDYLTHEGHRLNTNLFVGVATPECKHQLDSSPAFKGSQRHAGGDVVAVVTISASDFPLPLDGCVEVFFYSIDTLITDPKERTVDLDHLELTRWGATQMHTTVNFTNNFAFPIETFWIDESSQAASQGIMEPGETVAMTTFLGHVFYAVEWKDGEEDEEKEKIDFVVIDGLSYKFSPANRLETCEIVPGSRQVGFVDEKEYTCDNMETRFVEFSHNVWHVKRLGLNYVQPQLVPPVTKEGFMHIKLPMGVFDWLRDWYDKMRKVEEQNESSSGPCMNQHVSPSAITHLPEAEKERLSKDLKSLLEGWYGGELELTSIYGIRKYTNGSVLRMHVDTVNTHVVSAIINVDQQLDEEWPLLILDHDDNEHEILMRPGDMVLYESAKLLHGRPSVMRGTHYDNIFIHYRPVSGWDYSWV